MREERNVGLDLLRLVSMFMIVCLHVLGQGGVLVRYASHPQTYYASWVLETICMCAVDVYALLSGYVGVKSSFKPSRIAYLWLTVELYTVVLFLVLGGIHPSWITEDNTLQCFLPVEFKTYWYFSAYFVLFFLMPFLNRMVLALSDREKRYLLVTLGVIFCLFTLFAKAHDVDFTGIVGGYSLLWLAVLYTAGAALRLLDPGWMHLPGWVYAVTYAVMVFLSWTYKIRMENYTRAKYGETRYQRILVTYHSPTMVLCALCLLCFMLNLKIRSGLMRRFIRTFSPLAFSVYIIHTHPMIWDNVLKNRFASCSQAAPGAVIPMVLGTALLIFAICLAIDLARSKLFELLRIQKGLHALEKRLLCRFGEKHAEPALDGAGTNVQEDDRAGD